MGFSLKRMFKPPKWVRKMKPLKVLGKIAPFAAMAIPGIGPLAAAGIGAAGGLLRGGGIKGALMGGALGGLGGLASGGKGVAGLLGRAKSFGGSIGGALKGMAPQMAQRVLGGGGGGAPSYENPDPYGVGNATDTANAAIAANPIAGAPSGGFLGGVGRFLGNAAKGVGNWAADNPMTALAAGSSILGSIGAAKTGAEGEEAMRAGTYDPNNPYQNPNARRRDAQQAAAAALGGY